MPMIQFVPLPIDIGIFQIFLKTHHSINNPTRGYLDDAIGNGGYEFMVV